MKYPFISIVIPTRNSSNTLPRCLDSIIKQKYPKEKIEIMIIDAFSTDETIEIAKRYGCRIIFNSRIAGEAGKVLGLEKAEGEMILFVDSDNVLPSQEWLLQMLHPLQEDAEIVASEPIYYGYCKSVPLLIRYYSLIGDEDPLTIYLGFYGRYSHLKGRWTDLPLKLRDVGTYYKVTLEGRIIPTMGANGFLIRASAMKNARSLHPLPYLLHMDLIYKLIELGYDKFARVKTSIHHLHSSTLTGYVRKRYMRIRRYHYHHRLGMRIYPWLRFSKLKMLKLILGSLLVFPLFKDAVKGYKRRPDAAWFLHWLVCFLTIAVYGIKEIASGFYLIRQSREF